MGPNSTAGTPGADEADRVGGAVAPDADRLGVEHLGHALAQHAHERVVAVHDRGRAVELRARSSTSGSSETWRRISCRVLARQVADVDVDHAGVGHLVERVAAEDAAEVDRRPVEEVGALARERQRSRSSGRRRAPSGSRCRRATASRRGRPCRSPPAASRARPWPARPTCRSVGSPVIAKSPV